MRRFRFLNHCLLVSMLLSSAGMLASPCADAAAMEGAGHGAHHQMEADGAASATESSSDCCQQCGTVCGVAGCAALTVAPTITDVAMMMHADVTPRRSIRYASPSPHTPFRPPILL